MPIKDENKHTVLYELLLNSKRTAIDFSVTLGRWQQRVCIVGSAIAGVLINGENQINTLAYLHRYLLYNMVSGLALDSWRSMHTWIKKNKWMVVKDKHCCQQSFTSTKLFDNSKLRISAVLHSVSLILNFFHIYCIITYNSQRYNSVWNTSVLLLWKNILVIL